MVKGSKRQAKKNKKKLGKKYIYVVNKVYDGNGKSHVTSKQRLKKSIYYKKGKFVDAKGKPLKPKNPF